MLLLTGSYAYALSLADIELLVTLGIISGDQALIAKQAINAIGTSTGTGSSVRTDEFSTEECLVLNQNLVLGLSGTAVSALQRFLQKQGHYTFETITGQYGPVTKTAVTDFQIATGLITSSNQLGAGSVGPITREKIQEVSCNSLNQPPAPMVEVNTSPIDLFERHSKTLASQEKSIGAFEARVQSTLINEDKDQGFTEYRYTMDVDKEHNDLVDVWRVTLVCDEENVKIRRLNIRNRGDIEKCGDTVTYKASTKGNKTIKIKYTNTSNATQLIGVGVEALDKAENVLGEEEIINQLSAPNPKSVSINSQGFRVVDGKAVSVNVPEQRICNEAEQLDYLKYIMTSTIHTGNPILPPLCWPGNVQCTFDLPPSYCLIVGGPTSRDLCEVGQYFYDGKCLEA